MTAVKKITENGNLKKVLLIGLLSALCAVSGWMFTQVRDLPAAYMTKQESLSARMETRAIVDNKTDAVNCRLDRIEDRLDTIILKLVEISKEKNE